MNQKTKSRKNFYANGLLGIGIGCLAFAIYMIPTLITTEKSLVPKTGKVKSVLAFYTQVNARGYKSLKSELLLTLENDKHKYKLAKNIGYSSRNEKYELIEKKLKESGKATVWINKNNQTNLEPEVFRIETGDNTVLYDIHDVKSELKYMFPFLLFMSFFGIGMYIRNKNLMNKKPAHNKT
tara:strand:- start:1047 stop:1589 length:543 start_codon:yes stop_codon:yes gene_type:complete